MLLPGFGGRRSDALLKQLLRAEAVYCHAMDRLHYKLEKTHRQPIEYIIYRRSVHSATFSPPAHLQVNFDVTDRFDYDSFSRAIICYLCTKHEASSKKQKLYPSDLRERARVDEALNQDYQFQLDVVDYLVRHTAHAWGKSD